MQKRRMGTIVQQKATNDENLNSINVNNRKPLPKLTRHDIEKKLKNVNQLIQGINSKDPSERLRATIDFRRMLSVEDSPPIQEVIDCGVVPKLMEFLTYTSEEKLQFEAAWTITNIASGSTSHTRCIVENGGINYFVHLLGSPSGEVREQAVWALGNIAGDSPTFRDLVLCTQGSVQRLISILTHTQVKPKLTMVRNATWCMSNFCRGKPKPDFDQIKQCIPVLNHLVKQSDPEVLTDACWALSYVTDDQTHNNKKIDAVIAQEGICKRLIHLLQHGTNSVQVPALRTIGNIVTGDDVQTQKMLANNPLPALLGTLSCQRKNLRKETCWTISNITAGTAKQIQLVIDANLISPLVNILKEDQFDVQKEAAWAIANICSGGTDQQIRFVVSQAAIPALIIMMKLHDPKMVLVSLDAIGNILDLGLKDASMRPEDNKFADIIEEAGGLDVIEGLQRHENEEIYDRSIKILQKHFDSEEDDGMGMAPEINQNTGQFSFGHFGESNATPQFAF